MIDNDMNISYDVIFDYIETGNKEYLITITPSDEWLQTASYPVKIDPSLVLNGTANIITDRYTDNNSFDDSGNQLLVGKHGADIYKTYLQLDLSQLPNNSVITYALLSLNTYDDGNDCTDDCTIQAKAVNGGLNISSIIKNPEFSITESRIIDYFKVNHYHSDSEEYVLDISRNFQGWINNNYSYRVLELSVVDENIDGHISFNSIDYSTTTGPVIEIGYTYEIGLKDYWTYNEQSTSTAGTGYVSDYTGKLTFMRNDINFRTEKQMLSLSLIYNMDSEFEDIGYGAGWRTNYNIEMGEDSSLNQFYTIDGSGNKVYYVFTSCDSRYPDTSSYFYTCFLAEDGSRNLLVEKTNIISEIEDYFLLTLEQIEYHFGIDNHLNQIDDKKHNLSIYITYDETNKEKIKTVTDDTGNYIDFVYNTNGNLSTVYLYIKTSESPNVFDQLEKVIYTYSFNSTIQEYVPFFVRHNSDYEADGSWTETDYAFYTFYDNGNLDMAMSNLGMSTEYTYNSNNQVDTVKTKNSTYLFGEITYSYSFRKTVITNQNGDYVQYLFDNYGHTIQVINNEGVIQTSKYINIFTTSIDLVEYVNIDNERNYRLNHVKVYSSDVERVTFGQSLNDSFEDSVTGWTFVGDITRTDNTAFMDQVYQDILGEYGLRIEGDNLESSFAEIDITSVIDAFNSNIVTIGVWSYSKGTPLKIHDTSENVERLYRMNVEYTCDGEQIDEYINFNPSAEGWQYLTKDIIIIDSTCTNYKVQLEYKGLGEVYFDGLVLKDALSGTYATVSESGNITKLVNSNGIETIIEYSTETVGSFVLPLDSTPTSTKSSNNDTDIPLNSNYLPEFFMNNNVKVTPTYNSNGQIIENTYVDNNHFIHIYVFTEHFSFNIDIQYKNYNHIFYYNYYFFIYVIII